MAEEKKETRSQKGAEGETPAAGEEAPRPDKKAAAPGTEAQAR